MTTYRLPTWGFWRGFFVTMRPWLAVVSASAGLVGIALAGPLPRSTVLIGTVVFLATYGLGQALTDTTQTDTDALSAPERPLSRGALHVKDVLAVSLAGLAACSLALALLNPWTLTVCALCVAGLATYTWFKRRWWGGPAWNSWIVACLVWIGAMLGGGSPLAALARPGVMAAMVSTFFGYAGFVMLGYLKDVRSDRATGYDTLPVRFGRRAAVIASGVSVVFSLAGSAWMLGVSAPGPVAAGLSAVGLLAWIEAHRRAWRVSDDDQAGPAVAASVVGFVLTRAAEVTWVRPDLAGLAVLVALAVGPGLAARPNRRQV